ncbi:hypothetical protein BJ166DRAFT_616600 [Pestalotiopsis sp. NC0098]|nr:hypothetical protein BJ166DRAFT_616600 [Pestalotiopsis sp. NC0098]
MESQKVELDGIHRSLNELDRLALHLRQASMSSLDARVQAFISKRTAEVSSFGSKATFAIHLLYPDASEHLQKRLASSMTHRHAKLLYWQSHYKKLKAGRRRDRGSSDSLSGAHEEASPLATREAPSLPHEPRSAKRMRAANSEVSSIPSATLTSELGSRLTSQALGGKQPTRNRAGASTVLGTNAKFPSPPPFADGEKEKGCPFCQKSFRREDFAVDVQWRRHVNDDLLPFVCASIACNPGPSFANRSDWRAHMDCDHKGFPEDHDVCPLCCLPLEKPQETPTSTAQVPIPHSMQDVTKPLLLLQETEEAGGKTSVRNRAVRFDLPSSELYQKEGKKDEAGEYTDAETTDPASSTRVAKNIAMNHIADHLQFLALLTLRLATGHLADNDGDLPSQATAMSSNEHPGTRSTLNDELEVSEIYDDQEERDARQFDQVPSMDWHDLPSYAEDRLTAVANKEVNEEASFAQPPTYEGPFSQSLPQLQSPAPASSTSPESQHLIHYPGSEVSPPLGDVTVEYSRPPSVLHQTIRGSAGSPPYIESDRRTVITVDDPLADFESIRPEGLETKDEHIFQEVSPMASVIGLQSANAPREGAHGTQTGLFAEINEEHLTIKKIREELRSGSQFSRHKSAKRFIPYDTIRTTLTEGRVRSVLRQTPTFKETPPEVIDIVAHTICVVSQINGYRTSYIRIFAILVLMDRVSCIQDFLNEPVADADLPLRFSPKEMWGSNLVLKNSDEDDDPPLQCFEDWDPEDMDRFLERQDKLTSPRLRMRGDRLCLHRLRSDIILPFIECNYDKAHIGAFGTVSRVKIHPAHCDFDPSTLPQFQSWYGDRTELQQMNRGDHEFAMKEIHSGDYEAFRAEVAVHEKFSASRKGHEHLIRLLAAIEHGTSYYLLFPWAQGNLVDLWQRCRASPESMNDIEWMIKQCLGITDGLKRIHLYRSSWERGDEDHERSLSRSKGIHGDVKAENILFFDPLGDVSNLGNKHLVISDFGLTRFREKSLTSDPDGWSLTYRAPELDMHLGTSRKYDIWSLGCLFLEFISWFLRGFDATRPRAFQKKSSVITFQDARINDDVPFGTPYKEDKFFNLRQAPGIGNSHAVVKTSVLEWMRDLRQMDQCSEPMRSFLDLIESDMLVPDPMERKSMSEIHASLKRINSELRRPEEILSSEFFSSFPHVHAQTDSPDVEKTFIENPGMQSESTGVEPFPESGLHVSDSPDVANPQVLIEELERMHAESMQMSEEARIYPEMDESDRLPSMPASRVAKPSQPRILFTRPDGRESMPVIVATSSSAQGSRRNSQ